MKYAMYLAWDDFLDCFGGIFSTPEERAGYQANKTSIMAAQRTGWPRNTQNHVPSFNPGPNVTLNRIVKL